MSKQSRSYKSRVKRAIKKYSKLYGEEFRLDHGPRPEVNFIDMQVYKLRLFQPVAKNLPVPCVNLFLDFYLVCGDLERAYLLSGLYLYRNTKNYYKAAKNVFARKSTQVLLREKIEKLGLRRPADETQED